MEDLLDLYREPLNVQYPVVCMDEAMKELLTERVTALPMRPGLPQQRDYQHTHAGVVQMFMCFCPLLAWRQVFCYPKRTHLEWAFTIRNLVHAFPEAERIRLVMDNLNTHRLASLYKAFPAAEARSLARKLEFHFTPVHGSWLNMAEIEIGILKRQCLDRRMDTLDFVHSEVQAWSRRRNLCQSTVHWQFTTLDARIKLHRLYPHFDD
jgi:DDE superfamily endonuclease